MQMIDLTVVANVRRRHLLKHLPGPRKMRPFQVLATWFWLLREITLDDAASILEVTDETAARYLNMFEVLGIADVYRTPVKCRKVWRFKRAK